MPALHALRRRTALAVLLGVLSTVLTAPSAAGQAPPAPPTPVACPDVADERVGCVRVDVGVGDGEAPSGTVAVGVARVAAAGTAVQPPLVVVGDAVTALAGRLVRDDPLAAVAADRDVVLVDQRGTGRGTPALRCHEVAEMPGGARPEVDLDALLARVEACRARLAAEGVPLDAFTTARSAADVEVVRQALDLGVVDLMGTGSGAPVVREAVRRSPGSVRALVLDSPVTADANLLLDGGAAVARALEALSLGCTGGAPCADDLGALDDDLAAAADALATDPVPITVTAPDGAAQPGLVADADLLQAVVDRLSDGRAAAGIPQLLAAGSARDAAALAASITDQRSLRPGGVGAELARSLTRTCATDAARTTPEALAAAVAGLPEPLRVHWAPTHPLLGPAVWELCARWDVPVDTATPTAPLVSPVPVLAVAGGLDPVGTPGMAEAVAARAATGHAVVFTDLGHQPLLADGACGARLLVRFLADPHAAPDTRCADDPGPRAPSPFARVAGGDRIATAIAASAHAAPDGGVRGAVLTAADRWFDAVVGAPLASAQDGPLLLTGAEELDPRVAEELTRAVRPRGQVLLVGTALDDAVADAVAALGLRVRRIAGPTDAATAVAVADWLADRDQLRRVFVADARTFADPLVASPLAAAALGAVLPSDGDVLPAEVGAYLDTTDPEVIAVGGGAGRALPDVSVIAGATRYETAALVADLAYVDPTTFGLASGADFPDAATAGAVLDASGSPLLLTPPDALHPAVVQRLGTASGLDHVLVFGGASAVADAVVEGYDAAW